jgi:NAD(P)-dependent dehydrogenase (short-subunit alcohol dehydrogenase family)
MTDFAGKKILITGASSGIGRACALQLAALGAHIVAIGRNQATLADLGLPSATTYAIDLADEPSVKALMPRLKAEVGPLDGCVLAAGLHTFRPLMMESFADIHRPWSINVQSSLGILALLLKGRLIAKGGSIVLFSSAAARKAGAGAVSYAASKGAIEAATSALALELASQKIRVNAVSPGVVRTPMSQGFLSKLTAEQLSALEARHPMGIGLPEDVAGPVLFLLSSEARWITGVVLPVDGGYAIA